MTAILRKGRALVAGGAGFLGSHLCEALLEQGMEVICVDNFMSGHLANLEGALTHPKFSYLEADVSAPLPAEVMERHFDEIYNLACPASPPIYQRDPEHTLLTSVLGTHQLLQLAERTGARFLLTSTSEIYGEPLEHPQRETYRGNVNPIGPRACYDEGKRAAETLAFDFERMGRVQVRVVRIFNTYGPRLAPDDGRVVSNLIKQIQGGGSLTIYGDGLQTRSFCFVADMIAGLITMMRYEGEQPGPINLGNPEEVSILELAQRISQLTGVPIDLEFLPRPCDDPHRRRPDITKAKTVLGWQPTVSLDQGLASTISWFKTGSDADPLVTSGLEVLQ
ncbi:UDP-glucuronic acid decarboxylase family protein [Novosphingobium sp. PS1R-30]|uniref:UDP-glucuronic acid decarboxylase family protein n=1 Tax=Novosphingobium anseongense TaxID=3133436 RepID=A0ABU8RVC9_9SPHN